MVKLKEKLNKMTKEKNNPNSEYQKILNLYEQEKSSPNPSAKLLEGYEKALKDMKSELSSIKSQINKINKNIFAYIYDLNVNYTWDFENYFNDEEIKTKYKDYLKREYARLGYSPKNDEEFEIKI